MNATEINNQVPEENVKPEYELNLCTVRPNDEYREHVALECLKAMLINTAIAQNSFEVIADFAFRQADCFIAESRKPQI